MRLAGMRLALFAAGLMISGPVAADALNSGSGRSLIKSANEGPKVQEGPKFQKAAPIDPCHIIDRAGNMKYCYRDGDWTPVGTFRSGDPALYQLETKTAAATVISMPFAAAQDLTEDDLGSLLEEYTLTAPPSGPREMDILVQLNRNAEDQLRGLTAIVWDEKGQKRLLQATLFLLDYGVGIVETTQLVDTFKSGDKLSDAQRAIHSEFLEDLKISHKVRGKQDD